MTKNANYCSNCSAPMPLTGDCTQCGQKHASANDHEDNYRCAYSEPGRRCPASGSMSKSITGGGRYYCAAHWRHLDNPKMCSAILDDYEQNGLPDRSDWRDKLMAEHLAGKHDDTDSTAAA